MALGKVVEGFSISHAQVIEGTDDSFLDVIAANMDEDTDMYGVNSSSVTPSTSEYDNQGDDNTLSTWSWMEYVDVDVQAGYLSFPLIKTLTGAEVDTTEGDATAGDVHEIALWHEDALNVAPKPMLVKIPAKDKDGVAADLVIGFYRVQFKPITFDGPTYKDGLKINYNGRALMSLNDEKGEPFTDGKRRAASLIAIERFTAASGG